MEVSISTDDSPFFVKGKLATIDWGAFLACGRELKLRFRTLAETRRVAGPIIRQFDKDYSLQLQNGDVYFGLRGWGYKKIARKDAETAIAAINARRKITARPPTGWEWTDRRELYYGKGSPCAMEKSEQCP